MEKLAWVLLLCYAIWWVVKRSGQSQKDKTVDLIVFSVLLGMALASSF